jgi:ATP-dependent exoDNAse (exonuclease V) alpha subunit
VHRFKGLEADVIILVLTEFDDDRDKAIAYIGMSRARAMLIVLGPKSIKKELAW